MTLFRTLIILLVAGLVFGGTGYFAYELYLKPRKLDAEEKKLVAETVPTPIPDYSLPAYQKASALVKTGPIDQARASLTEFIASYPESPNLANAKAALGELNANEVFTAAPGPDKVSYTVGKGDALVKIASKVKSNAELIFRANNLETINLKIGQQLFVPQLQMSLTVNRAAKTVTLYNKGEFFKEYPVISLKIPGSAGPANKTKVSDKYAMLETKRVAFGDKTYAQSDRIVLLGQGIVLRGMPESPEVAEGATPPPAPPGIVVSRSDIDEIFLLVSRGTEVTIQ